MSRKFHKSIYINLKNIHSLNIAKCSVTSFYKIRTPVISDYFISRYLLDRKNVVKALGVIFDPDSSFSHHINYVVSKASNLVGFIKHTTSDFTDISAIIYLYKTIVLPALLYCSQIWSPYVNTLINEIVRSSLLSSLLII